MAKRPVAHCGPEPWHPQGSDGPLWESPSRGGQAPSGSSETLQLVLSHRGRGLAGPLCGIEGRPQATLAQVALRFLTQRPQRGAGTVGSSSRAASTRASSVVRSGCTDSATVRNTSADRTFCPSVLRTTPRDSSSWSAIAAVGPTTAATSATDAGRSRRARVATTVRASSARFSKAEWATSGGGTCSGKTTCWLVV